MSKKEKLVVEHFVVIDVKQLDDLILENSKLKQQLTKKDKTIEVLRDLQKYNTTQLVKKQNVIDEINKEFVQAVHDWKALCAEKDKEIEKLRKGEYQKCCQHCEVPKQDANDLVIRELKKVKNWCKESLNVSLTLYDEIKDYINQQIKELKGK